MDSEEGGSHPVLFVQFDSADASVGPEYTDDFSVQVVGQKDVSR